MSTHIDQQVGVWENGGEEQVRPVAVSTHCCTHGAGIPGCVDGGDQRLLHTVFGHRKTTIVVDPTAEIDADMLEDSLNLFVLSSRLLLVCHWLCQCRCGFDSQSTSPRDAEDSSLQTLFEVADRAALAEPVAHSSLSPATRRLGERSPRSFQTYSEFLSAFPRRNRLLRQPVHTPIRPVRPQRRLVTV